MRNLILVALVLQLLLVVTEAKEEYKFGDLISFTRTCACIGPTYKHFAVYVGDVELPGKWAGQDLFHRTGPIKATGDCGFGVLEKEAGVRAKDNYLDDYFPGEMGTPAHDDQITKRISHWKDKSNCGTYNLLTNNCEHLATHVRYGIKSLKQAGTTAGSLCKRGKRDVDCGKINELVKEMEENERRRDECNNKCSSPAENAVEKFLPHLPTCVALLFCALSVVVLL